MTMYPIFPMKPPHLLTGKRLKKDPPPFGQGCTLPPPDGPKILRRIDALPRSLEHDVLKATGAGVLDRIADKAGDLFDDTIERVFPSLAVDEEATTKLEDRVVACEWAYWHRFLTSDQILPRETGKMAVTFRSGVTETETRSFGRSIGMGARAGVSEVAARWSAMTSQRVELSTAIERTYERTVSNTHDSNTLQVAFWQVCVVRSLHKVLAPVNRFLLMPATRNYLVSIKDDLRPDRGVLAQLTEFTADIGSVRCLM